jgi:hypothetical protein
MFGALLGADLTAKQGVIFGYLARLLIVVPGAKIESLIDFLEEPEEVRPYLAKLDDPLTRRFFERQFFNKSFDETRQQILYRIYEMMRNAPLARMFSNTQNKVNLFDAMNRGSLILINTAKEFLKQEGTEIFGRFFIALFCQAIQERASIPEDRRRSTFIYIDEAQDYFWGGSEILEVMLSQSRKGRVGLTLAQLDTRLCEILMGNTATKLVGGLTHNDAIAFAKEMHCKPELLQSVQKRSKHTEFACFTRNLTPEPFILNVLYNTIEGQPKISGQDLITIRDRNRARFCRPLDNAITKESGQEAGNPLTSTKPELL